MDVYNAQLVNKSESSMLSPKNIVLAGSEEWKIEEDHQNIKIVDSSVFYNAYTLIVSVNIWYNTNMLKIHHNGMATFKNINKR